MPREAEMPEPYRLWLRVKEYDLMPWPGGLLDQPYVLMREFDVCASVTASFRPMGDVP